MSSPQRPKGRLPGLRPLPKTVGPIEMEFHHPPAQGALADGTERLQDAGIQSRAPYLGGDSSAPPPRKSQTLQPAKADAFHYSMRMVRCLFPCGVPNSAARCVLPAARRCCLHACLLLNK